MIKAARNSSSSYTPSPQTGRWQQHHHSSTYSQSSAMISSPFLRSIMWRAQIATTINSCYFYYALLVLSVELSSYHHCQTLSALTPLSINWRKLHICNYPRFHRLMGIDNSYHSSTYWQLGKPAAKERSDNGSRPYHRRCRSNRLNHW